MSYKPRFLTDSQLEDFQADLIAGMSNKDAESKYGFSSISYAKSRLGLLQKRNPPVDWSGLEAMYVEEQLTIKEISVRLEVSQCAVLKRLDKLGIERRRKGPR